MATPLAAKWNKAIDAIPSRNRTEALAKLNQERVMLKRELFNKFIELYNSDLEKPPNRWARGKKVDIAQAILRELDKPLVSLTETQYLLKPFKPMEQVSETAYTTGRIAQPLQNAQARIQALIQKADQAEKKYDEDVHTLLPQDLSDEVVSLQHAIVYCDYAFRPLTHTEFIIGERSLEKKALDYVSEKATLHKTELSNFLTLENELIATEKLDALRDILLKSPVEDDNSVIRITQRFLAEHSLNRSRQLLMKSFIEIQRKYEPDGAEWYLENIKSGGTELTVIDIFNRFFIPEYQHASHSFPILKKNLDDLVDEHLLKNCEAFLDWKKEPEKNTEKSINPNEVRKARAINDARLKIRTILENESKQMIDDLAFLEKHSESSEAMFQEMITAGEAAAKNIEDQKTSTKESIPTLAEQEQLQVKKHQGYLAACFLNAKKIAQQLAPKLEKKNDAALSANSAALFCPNKEAHSACRLRENISQMILFYRARRGVNKGDHANAVNLFEQTVKESKNLSAGKAMELLHNMLKKFWQTQVMRFNNDVKSLIDTVNSKEGHHMQRMVGMVLQDLTLGLLDPPVQLYKRYHGDYHLDLVVPKLNLQEPINRPQNM